MAKRKTHKDQHWVPASYLAAWCDPNCPANYTPYVNRITKDGKGTDQRAPRNIFAEKELYTITTPEGHRDLRLEHGLGGLEAAFADIRKRFIQQFKSLPEVPYLKLLGFVAAMHVRTPSMRDHHGRFWSELKERGEELEKRMAKATIKEKKAAAGISGSAGRKGQSMTLDDVRKVAAAPMQHLLPPMISAQMKGLVIMRCEVMCTDHDNGFITSDAPVVWFDPQAHTRPPIYRSPGLLTSTLEISIPISPKQCVVFRHGEGGGKVYYYEAPEILVSEINRRTRFYSEDYFVSRLAYVEPYWFDPGEEPPDSWERTHQSEKA